MSSTDANVDLSDNVPNGSSAGMVVSPTGQQSSPADFAGGGVQPPLSPKVSDPTTSPSGLSVNLDKQTLVQRSLVFGITLMVCALMFAAFGIFFFHTHFFRILIASQPYAAALAMAMLIIPSFLLWGLVRAVYQVGQAPDKTSDTILKEIYREMMKGHPLS